MSTTLPEVQHLVLDALGNAEGEVTQAPDERGRLVGVLAGP